MAEPIEKQFETLSRVDPGNMYYMGTWMSPWAGGTSGMSS